MCVTRKVGTHLSKKIPSLSNKHDIDMSKESVNY